MNSLRAIDVIRLHADDNIAVAGRDLVPGTELDCGDGPVTLREPVRMGHKISLAPIARGEPVRKYGQTIGIATQAVARGSWVHTQNMALGSLELDYASATEIPAPPAPIAGRTFQGYRRPDGKAGTRNYVAVISTVNCSATAARYIARRFDPAMLRDYPNVDGVVAFTHSEGCGMQHAGPAHRTLNRVLAGFARHANIGAYLLVGLGCEQATVANLCEEHQLVQLGGTGGSHSPPVLIMQDLGGIAKTVEAGVRRIVELLPRANDMRRTAIPASEIVLGTECGGSDGNSGITANPAVGNAADRIVACGGTAILAETPEIFGAEHLLTRRARSPEVAEKLLARIRWWQWYVSLFGASIDNNPSTGNKEGGLTTIAEKSLGAVSKGGTTALVDVYEYAERVTAKGLVVMDTPGYDPASVTGLVAGGANVVVFTTGRGSCFGCKPVPSIKVATNTPMYQRMIDDMDLNAGEMLQGKTVEETGSEIFEEILAVASGKKTKSELQGIGDEEFVPWLVGPTL